MSSAKPRSEGARPTSPPATADDSVELALEWLRREWRAGFPAGNGYRTATSLVARLRVQAATHQAAAAIETVVTRLDGYAQLPVARRPDELKAIATELSALRPLLQVATTPTPPIGLLPSATAPIGRAARPAAKPALPTPVFNQLALDDPVTRLPRVGSAVAKKLANLGVAIVGDLLALAPRKHIDYSKTIRIGSILNVSQGDEITVRGEIIELREVQGAGAPRVVIKLSDGSGWVRVTWFNRYLAKQLVVGDEIAVSGKLEAGYGALSFTSPEWEKIGEQTGSLSTGRLIPVYPLTQGLAQKTMRGLTRAALDGTRRAVVDFLPEAIRNDPGEPPPLPDLGRAYEQVHYPDSIASLELAQRRLAFDDLFLLQLGMVRRKQQRQALGGIPLTTDEPLLRRFRASLPFSLTSAQDRVLTEILADMALPQPMARLVQGDVGSGKTVVAAAAMLMTYANGHQAAMMAPTEILAEQHYHNLRGLYASLPESERPRVALLTGSTRAAARREIVAGVVAGEVDILVGTHALIQDRVDFARLGLTVVDEQHRFGVRQRATLPDKTSGAQPHQLMMTATPIPRTLNMVLNGDLEVSVIAELPPGRVPIATRRFVGAERAVAHDLVRDEVARGHQVFVICPLVEASEVIEARAAIEEAEWLRNEVFPDFRIATLHGRMSGKEKDAIMTGFRDHDYDVLVSTSVIEVGIDVPNATVMLIEGADRFGLAQLHQFRGRVGRGGSRSYCLLLADETSPDGEERLRIMVETDDGFVLAEKDLELRGPGDFIGTRQSGLPAMSWIDGSFDTRLLDRARRAAETVLAVDPALTRPEHATLAGRLTEFWQRVSPDVPV